MSKQETLDYSLNRSTTNRSPSPKPNNIPSAFTCEFTNKPQTSTSGNNRFEDIKTAFNEYNGKSCISLWIQNFQEQSIVFGLNEFEKLIYAKRLMSEDAALWLKFESKAKTFNELLTELRDEYSSKLNSALIHEKLRNRKKTTNETAIQYLYSMLEIGTQGNIEIQAIILYTINGLPGPPESKGFMYEAQNLKDFKQKLSSYEMQNFTTQQNKERKRLHCYNCGELHDTSTCPNRNKGPKCFSCGSFGHQSQSCHSQKSNQSQINIIKQTKPHEEEETEDETTEEDPEDSHYKALWILNKQIKEQRKKADYN